MSIGGGALTRVGTIEMLRKKALVITLMCDLDCLHERLTIENRPLFKNKDSKSILKKIFDQRFNNYFISSDLIFYNQDVSIEQAVEFLVSDIRKSGIV